MRLLFFIFMKRNIFIPLILCAILCSFSSCLTLKGNDGTPRDLMVRQKKSNSVVIDHTNYTLSYNKKYLVPNWVSWQLTKDEATTQTVKRKDKFQGDPMVEETYRAENYDYSGELNHTDVKLSRGHMAPFADMRFDETAAEECFLLSNICPQSATLNAGDWGTLETICREKWAINEDGIFIVCGPIFRSKHPTTIGKKHKVAVPDAFFKVVLSTKEGKEKAVGFIFENNDEKQPYPQAVRSVDEMEKITGYDFFYWLPNKTERKIEKKTDLSEWNGD